MGIYSILSVFLHSKREKMEETKKTRGGKREGAGRKAVGLSTTPMSLKLDNDIYLALKNNGLNKNRYINDAVREAMKRDKFI